MEYGVEGVSSRETQLLQIQSEIFWLAYSLLNIFNIKIS